MGQVRTARITRLAEFGAFVELEPGVEALAHVSTFAPTRSSKGWSQSVAVGTTAAFEILNIDLDKKRIGVALVEEGTTRAAGATASPSEPAAGAERPKTTERDELREEIARTNVAPEGFGSLADKLRGALNPREK